MSTFFIRKTAWHRFIKMAVTSLPITHSNLYPKIYDLANLYYAYIKAAEGKRYRPEVLRFSADLESNLIQIQNELIWKSYKTDSYFDFYVYEPKKRLVSALPFRDRVVQHALCNVIEPLFESKMIYDSYACRVGKGTHRAADRTQSFIYEAETQWGKAYCLKCDISHYFPSIPHDTLKRIVRRTISCPDTLWLIDGIIDSTGEGEINPRGIPIGNLTSQLFANVYLDQLDHFVKEVLCEPHYVRYMDDFIILGGSKEHLWEVLHQIETYLGQELGLKLNQKTGISPTSQGVDFCGYRIWPTHRLLRKRSVKKMKRKLKVYKRKYTTGEIELEEINCSIQSWLGHAKHADTYRLRRKMFEGFVLVRKSQ
jgi:RNA-directed DNA polymerase